MTNKILDFIALIICAFGITVMLGIIGYLMVTELCVRVTLSIVIFFLSFFWSLTYLSERAK